MAGWKIHSQINVPRKFLNFQLFSPGVLFLASRPKNSSSSCITAHSFAITRNIILLKSTRFYYMKHTSLLYYLATLNFFFHSFELSLNESSAHSTTILWFATLPTSFSTALKFHYSVPAYCPFSNFLTSPSTYDIYLYLNKLLLYFPYYLNLKIQAI